MEKSLNHPLAVTPSLARIAAPVACVDIGGTKVAVSMADARGIRGRVTEATIKQGTREALGEQVLALIERSCAQAGLAPESLSAIGVSSCGPFVLNQGLIELAAPNICGGLAGAARGLPNDWSSVPLEAPLRKAFNNVRIANDCVAALEAERRWGALQGFDHCAYVTWSTGIGVGLCVDGRVLRGKHGNAGHAGHMFVSDNNDALCGCGNIGDLEALVAGNSMARRFSGQGYADAAALLSAAQSGEATAVGIVDELCRVMGRGLYNLVVTLDLQRISLGGSVFWNNRGYLLPRLQAEIDGRLPALTAGVELVAAGLKDKVGDYAALALIEP
ncbi:MAG: ROK family protein [Polaromonas sp.]|nr:ROK family protein [Polaromonas sp.]